MVVETFKEQNYCFSPFWFLFLLVAAAAGGDWSVRGDVCPFHSSVSLLYILCWSGKVPASEPFTPLFYCNTHTLTHTPLLPTIKSRIFVIFFSFLPFSPSPIISPTSRNI